MTTTQTDRLGEIDGTIIKLRVPIHNYLIGWPDELEAAMAAEPKAAKDDERDTAKNEPTTGYGEFDQDGELEFNPDHKVMSLAGMAALLAARHDVVSKGEGVEPMGPWHDLSLAEPKPCGMNAMRAAVAFHAMMKRMRWPGEKEINTLEECLQGVESSLVEVAAGDIDDLATLNQLSALAGLSKRQMERHYKAGRLPPPDRKGGGGLAHLWKWANVRGSIEDISGRHLPEEFPGSRIVH